MFLFHPINHQQNIATSMQLMVLACFFSLWSHLTFKQVYLGDLASMSNIYLCIYIYTYLSALEQYI